jgi:hypothetical protein
MHSQGAPIPRSLVSVIEEMMISESKRYADLRLLRESLPVEHRAPTNDAIARAKATMERLSRFRSSVLCRPYVGISLPELARRHTARRDHLALTDSGDIDHRPRS